MIFTKKRAAGAIFLVPWYRDPRALWTVTSHLLGLVRRVQEVDGDLSDLERVDGGLSTLDFFEDTELNHSETRSLF